MDLACFPCSGPDANVGKQTAKEIKLNVSLTRAGWFLMFAYLALIYFKLFSTVLTFSQYVAPARLRIC